MPDPPLSPVVLVAPVFEIFILLLFISHVHRDRTFPFSAFVGILSCNHPSRPVRALPRPE